MKTAELFDVTGLNVVVTGGAKGLGRAIAEAMVDNGARVVLLDRDKERKQQDRKLDDALAQLVGVIGQSHQGLMQAMSKPRKAVIHRDPRTGKVIGASSVTEG